MFIHSPTVGPRFGRLLCVCWPLKNTTDQPGHKKISKLCDPFFPRKKNSSEKDRLLFSNSFLGDEPTSLLLFFPSLKDIYISFSSFFSLSLSQDFRSARVSGPIWQPLDTSPHSFPDLWTRVCVCVDSSSSVNGSLSWLRWCRAGQSRRCRALSFSFSGDSFSVCVCLDFRQPVSTVVLPWGRSQEGRKKRDKVYLNRKMGSD